jgi:hypothetical protein
MAKSVAFEIFLDKTPGFADVSVGHDIPPHITIDSPSFKAKLRHIECMCISYHIILIISIYIYIYIYIHIWDYIRVCLKLGYTTQMDTVLEKS